MLSSVAPQVARETDSCEKVQEHEGMCMHPLVQGMVSAGEDSPPREQFYRNEISNLFFSFLVLPLTSFLGVIFVIILELSRLNSVSQNSSLRLTWKNYIFQLYFFLTNKVSAKNNSQQQEYISRGILLSSDRIFEIFWLRTKKNVTSPLSCTKNSHPYEKSTWGGKKSLRVFTHHPSGSQSQDSCLF